MLRRIADLPIIVILLGLAGLAMLVPAAHATVLDADRIARNFGQSAALTLTLTAMMALATANRARATALRGYLAGLAMAYLLLPLVFALPFALSLPDTRFGNAWFEMVSCFTTTGASLYDAPGRLPPSLHLWRALAGWLGGFFTLVVASAILPPMNLGGYEVLSGRTPGRSTLGLSQIAHTADPSERMARQAMRLFTPYAAFTGMLWLVLLLTGEDGLVALSHAMSTLSTSGISPGVEFEEVRAGLVGELAVFAFLLLALTRRLLPGQRNPAGGPLTADPELRLAALILLVVPLVLFLRHLLTVFGAGEPVRLAETLRAYWGSLFTALSFLTTTGFESGEWDLARDWLGTGSPGLTLAALSLIGGGVATTAGGVKLLRIYALARLGQRELERVIHLNSVGGGGPEARRLRGEGARLAWVFFMLFATSIGFVTAMLTLVGLEFEPALVFGLAALTLTGPLAEVAASVPLDWAVLDGPAKIVLGTAMVVGRVEILAILALLTPEVWRR